MRSEEVCLAHIDIQVYQVQMLLQWMNDSNLVPSLKELELGNVHPHFIRDLLALLRSRCSPDTIMPLESLGVHAQSSRTKSSEGLKWGLFNLKEFSESPEMGEALKVFPTLDGEPPSRHE